jgi:hypothetical protein
MRGDLREIEHAVGPAVADADPPYPGGSSKCEKLIGYSRFSRLRAP